MKDGRVDRRALVSYLSNLSALHAGTFTYSVLTHVKAEIESGAFGYEEARKQREAERTAHLDNLVEKQRSFPISWGYICESWLVRRERQYRIVGTSVFVWTLVQDGYEWCQPACELCDEYHPLSSSNLELSMNTALEHWVTAHAA